MSNSEDFGTEVLHEDDRLWVVQVTGDRSGRFLVADSVELDDNGNLHYQLPDGRNGIKQPGKWEAAEEKPLTSIQQMYADGALNKTATEWLQSAEVA